MDLAGKCLVVWLSPEAIETFLGVLEPAQDTAMTTWTVAGHVVGEAGPGLWVRVKRVLLPNGEEMPLPEEPVYFLRSELVTTARLYDALPDVRRNGEASDACQAEPPGTAADLTRDFPERLPGADFMSWPPEEFVGSAVPLLLWRYASRATVLSGLSAMCRSHTRASCPALV